MSNPDSHRDLIHRAIASLQAEEAFKRELQKKVSAYQRKVTKAGAAYRQTIFEKVYAAAGIDPSEIVRRQAFQDSEAKKFLDSLSAEIAANSEEVRKRHEAQAKVLLHKPVHRPPGFPSPPAPAPIAEFLFNAALITFDTWPEDANQVSTSNSYAYGNNLARIRVDGSLEVSPFRAYINFSWVPPRDGTLTNLAAWVSANGSHSWSSQHKCIEAYVTHTVDLQLRVSPQNDGNFISIDSKSVLDFDWDKFPGCATDTGAQVIDDLVTLSAGGGTSIPVQGGVLMLIMIVVGIDVQNIEAHSVVDFETGAQAFNVPGVFLEFQ